MLKLLPFHVEGGMEWMFPLTLMLITLLGFIAYVIYALAINKAIAPKWLETIKQTGMFALAWGVLATIYGLYGMFKSLQSFKQAPPVELMMGGLQALLIALIYALIIFTISLLAYLILRRKARHSS